MSDRNLINHRASFLSTIISRLLGCKDFCNPKGVKGADGPTVEHMSLTLNVSTEQLIFKNSL